MKYVKWALGLLTLSAICFVAGLMVHVKPTPCREHGCEENCECRDDCCSGRHPAK
jgi:hypothetical protein